MKKKKLGDILVEAGLVEPSAIETALVKAGRSSRRLGEVLLDMELVTEEELARTLAVQLGYPYVNLGQSEIEAEAILMLPEQMARKLNVIPFSFRNECLAVAMIDPLSYETIADIKFFCGSDIKPVVATRSEIRNAIEHYYSKEQTVMTNIVEEAEGNASGIPFEIMPEIADVDDKSLSIQEKTRLAPIIRLTNLIIATAIKKGASDIHIEPEKTYFRVRNRIDGILKLEMKLPKWAQGSVVSRFKILANMDITERRIPQDGGLRVKSGTNEIDIRVSTLPASHGEKVVIRLLSQNKEVENLLELGFSNDESQILKSLIKRKKGLILVTGPTGSGKSTTLYTMLKLLKSDSVNIVTVENPIEYNIEGITQVQINNDAGLTFGKTLRSILRQDPDVIFVGEVRDEETASIVIRSAMTGHLVLTTLHTNDAISSVSRLLDLQVPPYLLSSLLVGIIAQRLVRKICPKCRVKDEDAVEKLSTELTAIGINPDTLKNHAFFKGKGCSFCGNTGYKGRIGIFEIFKPSERDQQLIYEKASEREIYLSAASNGMKMLSSDGIIKAKLGLTTLSELLRVIEIQNDIRELCPSCGKDIMSSFAVCPYCEQQINYTCNACGENVHKDWKFCPYCKHHLKTV